MTNSDKHPSIVNEHIVLSMAVLLLLMAGLMASLVNTQQVRTQTKAAAPVPVLVGQ